MAPNNLFELGVKDIELIENALRFQMNRLDDADEINELLSRIHNQKNWYRPRNKTYVSG
jgi:hypothetical protein